MNNKHHCIETPRSPVAYLSTVCLCLVQGGLQFLHLGGGVTASPTCTSKSANQSIRSSINQAITQSAHRSINQTINQSDHQSIRSSINQTINQQDHQSIRQSIKQTINQSHHQSIRSSIN
jgi:hypothetical protein